MRLVIRPAVPADAGAIAALHAGGWRETYRGAVVPGWPDAAEEARMLALWQSDLAGPAPGAMTLVAELDGGFAGFLATIPAADEPGTDLFRNLYVAPALRGRGAGVALLREGADRLAATGRRAALVRVVEGNSRARALYLSLGGAEGAQVRPFTDARREVAVVPYRWARLLDLARAARCRLASRLAPPAATRADETAAVTGAASGADHPVAAGSHVRTRRKQRLGDVFGLTDYGVNRVELDPGTWSSIPHWHSREDEFVYVLEGELTLVSSNATHPLRPGDCAGFPAGHDRPHHLENRGDRPAVYLEVGSRRPDADEVDYAGENLRIVQHPDGSRGFARRGGAPGAPGR